METLKPRLSLPAVVTLNGHMAAVNELQVTAQEATSSN